MFSTVSTINSGFTISSLLNDRTAAAKSNSSEPRHLLPSQSTLPYTIDSKSDNSIRQKRAKVGQKKSKKHRSNVRVNDDEYRNKL